MGIELTKDTYRDIAAHIGMQAQGSTLFGTIASGSIQNVDISIDDIMTLVGSGKTLPSRSPLDISQELSNISSGTGSTLFHYIIRGILNASLRLESSEANMLPESLDPDLMHALLEARNAHIVDTYERDTDQKTVFLYGALHFRGIYALLRERDPMWDIVSFELRYPYVP